MIAKTLSEIAAHQASILWMTCGGLLIFVAFFVGMLMWTSQRRNQQLYRSLSRMPLEDERARRKNEEMT